ncbi:MAG: hypothetical protein ACYTFY_16945 [Planctomycetota bacterium]
MRNLLIAMVCLFVFSGVPAFSEETPDPEKKITVEFDGVPIAKAIQEVCKKANLSFSINERAMRHAGAIVCSFKNISAEEALRALAESAGLDMYNTAWEENEEEEEDDEEDDDEDEDRDEGEEKVGVFVFQLNLEEGRQHHEEERERHERHGFNRMPEELREKMQNLREQMRDAEGEDREKIMKQMREIMMDFNNKNRGNNEGNKQKKKRDEERAVF